jgi:D-alanyl-D-alanine carboxypeptidase
MALRGAYFDPNIDPRLLRALEETGRGYKKHRVELFSGRAPRPKNPGSYHPQGKAVDVNLYDPESNKVLENFQDPASAQAYQAYANEVYKWAQQNDPELAKQLRWGGYFGGGDYARDWMHFDVDTKGIGTAGGNWEQGFDPDYVKQAGLSSAGGLAQMDAEMAAAGYTPEQRRNAIAAIESRGSGDYGAIGAEADPAGHKAYGRYQVMDYNIDPWSQQYLKRAGVTPEAFLKDPALQDQLFDAVYGDYVSKYGERGAASKWFTGSEKEPATSDVHGKLTGKSYADMYMEQLGRAPNQDPADPYASPSEGGSKFGGTGLGQPTTAVAETAPVAKKKKKSWQEKFTEGLGDFTAAGPAPTGITDLPRAALAQNTPTTVGDAGQEAELRRQNLAQIMARLNSGKLWG